MRVHPVHTALAVAGEAGERGAALLPLGGDGEGAALPSQAGGEAALPGADEGGAGGKVGEQAEAPGEERGEEVSTAAAPATTTAEEEEQRQQEPGRQRQQERLLPLPREQGDTDADAFCLRRAALDAIGALPWRWRNYDGADAGKASRVLRHQLYLVGAGCVVVYTTKSPRVITRPLDLVYVP